MLCPPLDPDSIYLSGGAVSPDGKADMQPVDMTTQIAQEYILYTVGHESGDSRDIVHFLNKEDMEHYVHTVLVPLHLEDDGFSPDCYDDITAMSSEYNKYGNYEVTVEIDGETWTKRFKVTATERFISYE